MCKKPHYACGYVIVTWAVRKGHSQSVNINIQETGNCVEKRPLISKDPQSHSTTILSELWSSNKTLITTVAETAVAGYTALPEQQVTSDHGLWSLSSKKATPFMPLSGIPVRIPLSFKIKYCYRLIILDFWKVQRIVIIFWSYGVVVID